MKWWTLLFFFFAPLSYASSVGVGMTLWQEAMELQNGSSKAKMESQLKGFVFSYDRHDKPKSETWRWIAGGDFAAGTLKGKGESPIPDQFNNQPWVSLTLKTGRLYQTSPVSAVGILVPLVYRNIAWAFDAGSGTTANDKKFSAGAGLLYLNQLTPQAALQASVVHQHMWQTTLWSAGLAFEF